MLRYIDFPSDLRVSVDKQYSNISHRHIIDKLYKNIVDSLTNAAIPSKAENVSYKNIHVLSVQVGWNRYVKDTHREATLHFNLWCLQGRPRQGMYFVNMCKSRSLFKAKVERSTNQW